MAAALLATAAPFPVTAQSAAMWLDAAAASARPPAGVTGQTSIYGLLGGHLRLESLAAGALEISARGGRGAGEEPASWGEGEAAWELGGAGRYLAWSTRTSAFGLSYAQPFDYHAGGAAFQPRVAVAFGSSVVTLMADARRGSWSLPATALQASTSGVLALTGGAASLGRRVGPAWIEAAMEGYRGALDGWFTGPSVSAVIAHGPLDIGLSARAWHTPLESELGLSGSVDIPAGAAGSVHFEVGRSVRDPLYGTPGSLGGSVGVSLRLAASAGQVRPRPVVELGDTTGSQRRARFRLHQPRARAAALTGDFTDWRPRPMVREGDDWVLELTLPEGVYHFAFVVDGQQWTVPRDAPGAAEDEWGRRNATLVVTP